MSQFESGFWDLYIAVISVVSIVACALFLKAQTKARIVTNEKTGHTWDEATLDKFIESPDQVIPNNNMKPYKGISDPAVRKQIVDFLKSQSASP